MHAKHMHTDFGSSTQVTRAPMCKGHVLSVGPGSCLCSDWMLAKLHSGYSHPHQQMLQSFVVFLHLSSEGRSAIQKPRGENENDWRGL